MFNSDQDRLSDLEERLRSMGPVCRGPRPRSDAVRGRAGRGGSGRAGSRDVAMVEVRGRGRGRAGPGLWAWPGRTSGASVWLSQLDIARLTKPAPAPVTSTSVLMAEQHERAVVPDPSSYLALIRQVSRLEHDEALEPASTEPASAAKVEPTRSLRNAPLRPRDIERVIAL